MAHLYNIYEAKTNFSHLIDEVMKGREILIGKANKLVAKLVPSKPALKPRKPGLWKGKVKMLEGDIRDSLPDDIIDLFYKPTL